MALPNREWCPFPARRSCVRGSAGRPVVLALARCRATESQRRCVSRSAGLPVVLALALLLSAVSPSAAGRPVLTGVDGTPTAAVVAGEGVIYASDELQRNWELADGVDPGTIYTTVIALSNERFLVGAAGGGIWASSSSTGDAFFFQGQAMASPVRGMAQITAQVLAVGDAGAVARSAGLDGASWVAVSSPTLEDFHDVAAAEIGTSVVIVGDNGTVIRGGGLGNDLQLVDLGVDTHFYAVVSDPTQNGKYLIVGEDGEMWESTGAAAFEWTRIDAAIGETLRGAAQIGSSTVVVGESGAIYYSGGGFDNWGFASVPPLEADLREVAYTQSTAVACGEERVILWSVIGLNWTRGGVTPVHEVTWGRVKDRFAP